jgi:hypothetical protein
MKTVLLDNASYNFTSNSLPALISGIHKSGSSYLSIILVAQLVEEGEKIIFFTAFPMAKDMFIEQLGRDELIGFINSPEDIASQSSKQVLLVNSGDLDLFIQVIQAIDDLNDRTVYIKNIDEYEEDLSQLISGQSKVVFQGDVDKCAWGGSILQRELKTKIYFTQPVKDKDISVQKLRKYEAELFSPGSKGVLATSE